MTSLEDILNWLDSLQDKESEIDRGELADNATTAYNLLNDHLKSIEELEELVKRIF
jgi:hypothetical protein